jgi:sialic acid synthase SpsE
MKFPITENRGVGDGEPVFIIAEVGNNHQGKMENALAAIDFAHEAGADAVTFQYAPLHTYCTKDMYEHPNLVFLKDCELALSQLSDLRERVKKKDMAFSINVEDADTLDTMLDMGLDFIKLCSADLTNLPYIRHCATKDLPIFFSTGAAYMEEIERAYNAMREAGLRKYVIYHTNSGYPTPVEDANIVQMDLLHDTFGGVKGYCDHTVDIIPPVIAASRGAKVIEKHITTDRGLKGDDWMVSLEPGEFKAMVGFIRQAEQALGSTDKKPLESEQPTRTFKRKSIVSKCAIPAGTLLREEHLCYKLPGTGIAPFELHTIVGCRASVSIPADTVIVREMVQASE